MSVPLDRLYHYIKTVSEKIHNNHVIIYRFFPHGSKKIEDLKLAYDMPGRWLECKLAPEIFCHDQEPLNYKLYQDSKPAPILQKIYSSMPEVEYFGSTRLGTNLWAQSGEITIWDYVLLLHSEKRSSEVELYKKSNFIPVYYWNHAFLARDWFRYAEHAVFHKHSKTKLFLIYNRAWSGTREYRLKFADLLIKFDLQKHCLTSISPVDPNNNIHYDQHSFDNPVWKPCYRLENYLSLNQAQSHYSADFDYEDYNSTNIEIVLETLFDDNRLHLTEKALRPIACGQPFILASCWGSLEYLRKYGFKTFDSVWNEDYDQIQDPEQRLYEIINLMQKISQWDHKVYSEKIQQAMQIADYNRKHFFSKEFSDQISNELKTNLTTGFFNLEQFNFAQRIKNLIEICRANPEAVNSTLHYDQIKSGFKTAKDSDRILEIAQKYYNRSL